MLCFLLWPTGYKRDLDLDLDHVDHLEKCETVFLEDQRVRESSYYDVIAV